MDLDLKGKRALITGASRGIGLTTARSLLAEGAAVGVCARDADALAAAAAQLGEQGTVFHRAADVSDPDAITELVEAVAGALGGLDIVVVNASASVGEGPEAWENNFRTDLMSLVRLLEAAAPHLERSDAAAVVAIASTSALEAGVLPTANSFGALKAAMIQHVGAQARALGPKGIRVNAVSPGPVYFDGGAWDHIKNQLPALYDGAVAATALGRLAGPEDVARTVTFLASPAARHITGVNLVVDGGFTNRFDF
ncbi:SDR family oxidoreductase [Nocardia otitidiscaviarum]|uniref:SDR family oxidoreductase n=1 Tax=Nocardia otitidiscaviarum TaxID=1823 RepID=A0A516NM28_9NOCA|nr:SDR family oxidoreductase [Nocardia otitidiscaviarum]MCP9624897.1 SDR family oxidoreductase [Nocardia otitidiscaviarum]QDP79962.1 SDR family oxidoreductase [Nocardia otitidiscaviarum]